MPVPLEIRTIPRPKNTIVKAYGVNKDKYLVISRLKSRKDGDRYIPVNGPTVGHIINGVYIPIEENLRQNISMIPTDFKSWGCYVLCDNVFRDILTDLKNFYSDSDALRIYVMAILRVCHPGIRDCRLDDEYDQSWLSELYPDVGLSKNTVSEFQKNLGRTCSIILAYMKKRCNDVHADHHLIIDGTLKTDDSVVNDFSAWSRKARLKNRRDISVLYAYDQESREPVCSQAFPGNMIDAKAYKHFLNSNKISKGIVVVDKGFHINEVRDYFKDKPDLHYLNPLNRNCSEAAKYNLYDFQGKLALRSDAPSNERGTIYYKKVSAEKSDGTKVWLYSYRDVYRAMMEEETWSNNYPNNVSNKEKDIPFDELLRKKQPAFGTIVMESDLDLSPEEIYLAYDSRWDIEIMMLFYKDACEFDKTEVHSDYSVMGAEFIDFFATLLTYRLKKQFQRSEYLSNQPYLEIMEDLHKIKMIRIDGEKWQIVKPLDTMTRLMQETGLEKKPEPKKRGRPSTKPAPDPNQPKRKRGRPRIHPLPDPNAPKRKPGRPKGSKNKKKEDTPSDSADATAA